MTRIPLTDLATRYAFCDPASGKQPIRKARARSAIIVIAPDALHRIFVLHSWAKRCSTAELIDTILGVNATFHPAVFGIEANAMQALFADAVGLEAKHRSVALPLTAVHQPTNQMKEFRIRTAVQPVLGTGRLFIAKDAHELRTELLTFPMSLTKDLVDALASALALVPPPPTRRDRDGEAEALARYLRETGAPAYYIEQRMRELIGA